MKYVNSFKRINENTKFTEEFLSRFFKDKDTLKKIKDVKKDISLYSNNPLKKRKLIKELNKLNAEKFKSFEYDLINGVPSLIYEYLKYIKKQKNKNEFQVYTGTYGLNYFHLDDNFKIIKKDKNHTYFNMQMGVLEQFKLTNQSFNKAIYNIYKEIIIFSDYLNNMVYKIISNINQ
jgi:hypothetical protein